MTVIGRDCAEGKSADYADSRRLSIQEIVGFDGILWIQSRVYELAAAWNKPRVRLAAAAKRLPAG